MAQAHRSNPAIDEVELKNLIQDEVFFGVTDMADQMGVSREGMRQKLKDLEEEGYIEKRQLGQSHLYHRPYSEIPADLKGENKIDEPQADGGFWIIGTRDATKGWIARFLNFGLYALIFYAVKLAFQPASGPVVEMIFWFLFSVSAVSFLFAAISILAQEKFGHPTEAPITGRLIRLRRRFNSIRPGGAE